MLDLIVTPDLKPRKVNLTFDQRQNKLTLKQIVSFRSKNHMLHILLKIMM